MTDQIFEVCLEASNGDHEAARAAAELLSTRTIEELERRLGGAAMSHEGTKEHYLRAWVDEWGVTHLVSVPLCNAEQRSLDARRAQDRSQMSAMLSTIDAELERMAPKYEAALALVEKGRPLL